VRSGLVFGGRMPMTPALPTSWHETANIHLCTIDDFLALVAELGFRVESATYLAAGRRRSALAANLLADQAVFVLGR
jgi:methionine biosynthesis protein MetW